MGIHYQKLGLLSGVAAAGLATLLSRDPAVINAQGLDGRVNKIPIVAQAQNPLDEYLEWFREFTNEGKETGIRNYHRSINGYKIFAAGNNELEYSAIGRENIASLDVGNFGYYIARLKGRDWIFEFTNQSFLAKRGYNTLIWRLSPNFAPKGFYIWNSWSLRINDEFNNEKTRSNMTQEEQRDFMQLGTRFREFLNGIRRAK